MTADYQLYKKAYSELQMTLGFVMAFILGWVVWSFTIASWRLWAFEKVDPKFHKQLKKEAIKAKLIWPDGHIFERTEIRTKKQRAKIQAINKKINRTHSQQSH